MIHKDFEIVIGLEVHVQLNTISKMFCADENTFGEAANTHTSAISLAHPGTLPQSNIAAVEKGIALALAIGASINKENRFDRKHYFYADLPKAYQITQDRLPICVGGSLKLYKDEKERLIRFHHIHMEEDAGKSIHDLDPKYSLIDLNRAGTPLLEIVTEPDLRSAQEVHDFIGQLQHLVKYIGVSDANMEEGSLRADVNVSIRKKGETILNNRCEVKNVNSKKFAMQAVEYEAVRQIKLMQEGHEVEQQTLHFDPASGKTSSTRDKEDAHDYRYFPDPDLPPVYITDEQIKLIKAEMPVLPKIKLQEYISKGIPNENAEILIQERETIDYCDALLKDYDKPKQVSNFIINKVLPDVKDKYGSLDQYPLTTSQIHEFINLIEANMIVHSTAYQQLYPKLLDNPDKMPAQLCEEMGLYQSNDDGLIDEVIKKIIESNPEEVKKFQSGKKGLIGFFVGQAMKETKGKSNPKIIQEKLLQKLNQNA